MPVQKLTSTDAFVVVDIPDVPAAGIVRCARKILESSATDLARTATYTYASFGHKISGASAGINAEGDAVGPAVEAFVAELLPAATAGRLILGAAKGVDEGSLAPLVDAARSGAPLPPTLAAHVSGVVAATQWALGGLDAKRVAIEGDAPPELAAALTQAGAEVVDVPGVDTKPWMIWGAAVDAVLAGSRMGALTDQGAAMVKASAIVPWGAIPVTTKAFAMLRRRGVAVLPDFITTAGLLIAGFEDGDEAGVASAVAARVTSALDAVGGHAEGPLLGACLAAEEYLAGWTDVKLFGRPLAG